MPPLCAVPFCQVGKKHNIVGTLFACRFMKALLNQTRSLLPTRRPNGMEGTESIDPPQTLDTPDVLGAPTPAAAAPAQDVPQPTNAIQRFAARTRWADKRDVLLLPTAFEAAEKLRQDGWLLLPWKPLLGWDFTRGAEANRSLKEDWKALWMGHVHGEDTAPDDPKAHDCAASLGVAWDPARSTRCALAFTEDGKAVGFAAFKAANRIWTPTAWHVADTTETPRVLLAASLRAARDARTTVLNPCSDNPLAISRGAEWFWEYWPVQNGGARGALAQRLLQMQRRSLDKRNGKLLAAHGA
jgi:hypothetical protein